MGQPLTKLKKRREELKLSHGEFGSKVGVSAMTVYRWERGDSLPRQKHWPKLAEVTDLTVREILAPALQPGGERC